MRKERAQEEAPVGFNFQVHYRNEKTGLVDRVDAYNKHVFGGEAGRIEVMERPKGSGNCWDAQNRPAGRVVLEGEGRSARLTHKPDDAHIEWIAPQTADQKLAHETAAQRAENVALKKELAALKAESDAKAPKTAAMSKSKES